MMGDLLRDIDVDSAAEAPFDMPEEFEIPGEAPEVSARAASPIQGRRRPEAEPEGVDHLNEDQVQSTAILNQIQEWRDDEHIEAKDVECLMAYVKATTAMFNATVELQVAYLQALKYFCREILSQELVDAVNDLRMDQEVMRTRTLTWANLMHIILRDMKDLSAQASLLAFVNLTRAEGSTCKHWLDQQRAYRSQLTLKGLEAPGEFWLPFAVNQMSHQERTLLRIPADTDLDSINLEYIADALENVDRNRLGKYFRGCGLLSHLYAASLPADKYRILTTIKATRPGTDAGWNTPKPNQRRLGASSTTNARLSKPRARVYETRTQTKINKTAKPVSKEQRQKWRKENKCLRCGSSQHMIRDCPLEPSSEEKAYRKERLQKQRGVRFQQEPDDDEVNDAEGDDRDDESVWDDLSEDGTASIADPDEDAASDCDE